MKIKRAVANILLACAAIAATGCASLPSPEAMKTATADFQLPKLPSNGEAMVYVVRPSWAGGLDRFDVSIDTHDVGYTRGGQYIYFSVQPGEHMIRSKADNWGGTSVYLMPGEIKFLQQDPFFFVLGTWNQLHELEDLPGKYLVKNLFLGTILQAAR